MPFVQGTTDPTKGTVSQKGTKTNLAEEALASDRSELSQNSGEGFRQGLKDTRNTIAGWGQKAWTKLTSARDFDLDKAIELRETENYLAGIDYTKLTDEGKKEYDNVQNNLIKEWSTVAPYKIDIDKMNETVDNIINSNTYQKAKAVAEKNETEPTYKVDLSKKLKTAFYADVLNGADKKDRFFYNTENGGYTTYKPEETGMIVDEVYNALESRALGWAIDAIAETEDRIREGKPYNAKAYERAKEQYTDLKDFAIYAVNNSEKLEDFGDLVMAYKEETGKNPLVTTNEFGLNENSGTFYSRQFLREDLLDPNLNSGYKIASGIGYLFNAVGTVFDQGMALGVGATNTVKDIFDDGILFNGNVAKDYDLFDNMEFNSIYDSLAKNESGFSSARKIAYQVYDRIPDVLSMIGSSPKLFGRTDKILDTLLEQGVRDSAKKFAGTYEKTTEGLTKAIEGIEQLKKGGYVTQQVFKTILKDGILDNVVANAALKGNEYREYTPEDLLFDIGGSIVFDGLFMSLRLAKAGDVLTKNKGLFKQELAKKHFGINDWDRNMMSNDDKLELGRFMDAIVDTTKMTDQMTVKRVEAMKKLVQQQYKDIDSAVDEIMKNAKYQGQKIIDFAANSKKWSNYVTKDANGNNVLKGSLSLDDTLTLRRDYIKDRGKKFDSYIKDKTYQGSWIAAVKESIKEEGLTIDGIKKGWNKFKSLKEEAQKDFLSDMWLNMSSYDQYVFDVWKTKNKLKDATKPTELYAQLQTFKNVLSLHKRELRAQGLARTDWVLRNESALLTKSKTIAERWKDIVLRKMRRSRDPVYSAGHIRDWEDTKFLLTNQVKNNGEEFLAKIFDVIEGTVPPQELELWLYCDPIMRRQGNEFHFRADSMISNGANWGGRYFNNPLEIAYFVGVEGKIKLPMPDGSERYLYYKMSGDNNPDGLASSIKYDVTDPLDDDFYTSFLIKADGQITGADGLSDYLVPHLDHGDEDLVWIFENGMNKGDSDFSVFDIEDSDYKKLIDILSTTVDDMTMGTSNDVRQLLEKEIEEVKETQEFPTPNVDPKLTNTQETREVATEVVGEVNKVTDLGEDSEVVTKEAKEEPISPKKKKELRAQRNALVGILKAVAGTKTNNPGFVDNGIIKKASMGGFIGNELYQDAIGKVPGLEELIDEPTYYRLQKLWNSRGYTTNDIQESLTKMMDMLLSKRYSVNAERGSFSISFNGGMKKNGKQQYFSEPSWIDEMGEYAGDKGTAIFYSVDQKVSALKTKKDKSGKTYTTGDKEYKDIYIFQYHKTKDGYKLTSPVSKTSDEKVMDIKIINGYRGKKLRLTGFNKPKADKNYEESTWAPNGTLVFMKDVDPQKLEVDVKKQFNISNVNEIKAQLTFNGKIPLDTEIKDTSTVKDIIEHYAKKFGISISDPRTTLSEIQTNINEDYISDVFEALRDNVPPEVSDNALTAYIVEWLEESDIKALIDNWRSRYGINLTEIDMTDPTEYIRMKVFDDYGLVESTPSETFIDVGPRVWKKIVDKKVIGGFGLGPTELVNMSNDEINRIIKEGITVSNYIDKLSEGDPLRIKLDSYGDKRLGFVNDRIKSINQQWITYDNGREALKKLNIEHRKLKDNINSELKEGSPLKKGGNITKERIKQYRDLGKEIIERTVSLRDLWTNIIQQQRSIINSPKMRKYIKSYVGGLGGNGEFNQLEEVFEYYNNIIDYDSLKHAESALDTIFKYSKEKSLEKVASNIEPKQIGEVEKIFEGEGKTKVSNVINHIISRNDKWSGLAKKLLDLVHNFDDLDVIVDNSINSSGKFNADKNSIFINLDINKDILKFERTFLHELLHGIVYNGVHTPEQRIKFNDIFQSVRQSLFKKYGITKREDTLLNGDVKTPTELGVSLYGTYNLDEFITELFTNQAFVDEIDSIDKSFFRKLVDWIVKLFSSEEKTSDVIKGQIYDLLKNANYKITRVTGIRGNNNLKRSGIETKLWIDGNQDMSEFKDLELKGVKDGSILYDRPTATFTYLAPNGQSSNLPRNWWLYARTKKVQEELANMPAYKTDDNGEPTLDVLRAIKEDKNVETPKEVKDNIRKELDDKIVEKVKEVVSQSEPKPKSEFSDYNVNSFVLNHNRFFWENKSIPAVRGSVDGNPSHSFGNPFDGWTRGEYGVGEATKKFEEWLAGTNYQDVNPEQREWIIGQIKDGSLKGWPVVYYTKEIPQFRWYRYKDPNTGEWNSTPVYPNDYSVKYYDGDHPNHAMILQRFINEGGPKIDNKNNDTTIVKNSDDDRIRNTTKLRDNITVKVKDEPIVEGVTSDNSKAVEIKNDKAKEEIDENNKIVDDDEGILPTKSDGWKQFTLIDDIKYGPGVDPNKTVKTFNLDGSNHTWVSKYSSLFNQKGIDTGNDYLKRIFYQEKGKGETPLSSAIRKLYNVRKSESIINTLYESQLIFADIQALRYGVPIPEPRLVRYMQILGLEKIPKVDTLVRLLADYHHKNYEGLVISNDGNFVRLDQKLRDYDNEARELFTSGLPGLISGLSKYIGFVKKLKRDRETLTNSIKKAVGDSINYDILSPIYVTKRKALEGYKGELEKIQERYDKFYSLLTKANKNRSLTNQEIEKLNKIKKEMTPIKSKITKATKALKKLEDGLLGGMTQSQISIQLRDLIKSQRDLVNSLKGHYDELASKEGQAMWDTIKETDEDDSYYVQYANKELVQKENNKNVKVDTNKKEQDIKQKEDIVKDSKEESYKKEKKLLEERAEEIRSKIDTENAKSYRDEEKIEALNQELESVNDSIDDIDYILQTNRVEKASSGGGISDIDKIRSELGKAELRLLELERIERLESSFWKKSNKISGAIYNWLKNISSGELSTKYPFQRWAFSDPESPAKIFYKDRGGNIIEKDLNGDVSRFMNRILVYGDLPEYKGEGGGVYKKLNNSIKEFLGIPTDKTYKKMSKYGEGFSLNDSLYKSNLFQKGAVVIDSNSIKDIDSSIIDAINSKMNDGKYVIMVSGSNIENMKSLDKQLNDRGYVKIEKRGTNGIPYILQNEGYIYVPKDTDLKAKEKRLIRRAKIETDSIAETCEISLIAESLEGVDM